MKFKTEGFPKKISEYIELPDLEELLFTPFLMNVDAEEVMKKGTEFQKYLLSKTPITNTKKYVTVQMIVQYLFPQVSSVTNINANDKEWHVDGDQNVFDYDDNIFHLLLNDTDSMTEFNTTPFETEDINASELIKKLNDVNSFENKLLTPKKIEPNKIITFNNTHIHRANRSKKKCFRLFYRVAESNAYCGDPQYGNSFVYNGSTESILNISQTIYGGKVQKIDIYKELQ
jgi:hypothetical protein